MSDPVTVRLLGTPSVVGPRGADVGLPLGKPLAALCYVALEATAVTRDDLGALLWPDVPRRRARASVRQALWLLRRHLPDDAIREADDRLALNPDAVERDVDRLEVLVATDDLEAAWEHWGGGLLRGFSVPDAPSWNLWADRVREVWARRFGAALETRAGAAEGDERVLWLRRALEVQPHRERVYERLLDELILLGRRREAEATLHEARSVVDRPRPGLFEELERRLRALQKEEYEGPDDPLEVEFVGRAAEFSRLTGHWRSVVSGRPRTVVILGPAGIGKTRLAEQLVALARVEGAQVVQTKGTPEERGIELGALTLLAKELLSTRGAAGVSSGSAQALHSLVPSRANDGGPAARRPARAVVADAFADLVAAVAHEGPLVLRVEDVQWIDADSLAVLARTMRGLGRAPVHLLMTCRTEDADASPLRSLRGLEERGEADLVTLPPLARAEIGEMLGLMFTFPDPEEAAACADRLYGASGGNPLFLLELLHHLRDEGLIHPGDDPDAHASVLSLPEEINLPPTVHHALRRRLSGLDEDARALAGAAARSKVPLSPDALARRGGLEEPRATEAVGELLRRGILRWTHADTLELAHDSLRDALSSGREGSWIARLARRPAALGAAVLAVALAVVFVAGRPGLQPTAGELGDRLLFSEEAGRLVGYEVRLGPDGTVELAERESIPYPEDFEPGGPPVRSEGGGWVVPGWRVPGPGLAPDAWILEDGALREVLATPGDDVTRVARPDLGQYLVQTQDPDNAHFRMTLARVDADSGGRTVLAGGVGAVSWSEDGRAIVAHIDASWDSVRVLRPDGEVVGTLPGPTAKLVGPTWCDARGEVTGVAVPPGDLAWAWAWKPGEPEVRPLALRYPPLARVSCSPGGGFYAYSAWVDGSRRFVLDAGGGERVWVLPRPSRYTFWEQPLRTRAPRAVRMEPDSLVLRRGERARLVPEVEGPQDLGPDRAAWASSDSLTAFATAEGDVIANAPGEATIRYSVDGWLSDSVHVTVLERPGAAGLRFSDPLTPLDEDVWYVHGFPTPRDTVDGEGRPALSMEGDGRFSDGIISRSTFDLQGGATAEVDFQLPLTRRDRQQFRFCLRVGERIVDGVRPLVEWPPMNICFAWPAGELQDFDPREALFSVAGSLIGAIDVGRFLRDDDWNRVSLQVHPDGRVILFLNGRYVKEYPGRVDLVGRTWNLRLVGRAADTELWVRNAALWGVPIYRLPRDVGAP